jgi:hypothetical protein
LDPSIGKATTPHYTTPGGSPAPFVPVNVCVIVCAGGRVRGAKRETLEWKWGREATAAGLVLPRTWTNGRAGGAIIGAHRIGADARGQGHRRGRVAAGPPGPNRAPRSRRRGLLAATASSPLAS